MKFIFYRQLNAMDCGPTCLRMVAKYYGKHYNTDGIREVAGFGKEGVSLLGLSEAAEKQGFRTRGVQLTYKQLTKDARLPCILHWEQSHFVVLTPLPPLHRWRGGVRLADPAKGIITLRKKDFLQHWAGTTAENGEKVGIAILPTTNKFWQNRHGPKSTVTF